MNWGVGVEYVFLKGLGGSMRRVRLVEAGKRGCKEVDAKKRDTSLFGSGGKGDFSRRAPEAHVGVS